MLKKYRDNKGYIILSVLSLIIFCMVVDFLFIQYGKRMDQEFQHLEEENLTAYAVSQSKQVEAEIEKLTGRMKATAELLASTGLDPQGSWFTDYLEELSSLDMYRVTYEDINNLIANIDAPGTVPNDHLVLEQLLRGESVMSDLRFSNRLNGYYFALAEPVVRDGKTIGALRSVMNASVLTDSMPDQVMHETFKQYIVDKDGTVLYSDAKDGAEGQNLLEDLKTSGLSEDTLMEVKRAFQEDCNLSVRIGIPGEKVFYITTATVGYKSWNLVKFAHTEKVNYTSKRMLRYTACVTSIIMVLMASAGLFVFVVIYRQKKKLLVEQAGYDTLASFSDIIIFRYYFKTDSLEFSPNITEYLNLEENYIPKLKNYHFKLLHPDDENSLMDVLKAARETEKPQKAELRVRGRQNVYFWMECRCQMVEKRGIGRDYLLGTLINVSDRKEMELDLRRKTDSDPLTGLLNRRAIEAKVNYLLKKNKKGFLFMIDLDNFKQINDTYGHGEGDLLLYQIGVLLKSIFRESDPVARVGGDEFLAFMADADHPEYARQKADVFLGKLFELSENIGYHVSASIGIAGCPPNGSQFELLYDSADQAMYCAKKAGKHGYAFADGIREG